MTAEAYLNTIEKLLVNIKEIRKAAHNLHDQVNQTYDDTHPYGYHLDMVAECVFRFGHAVCQREEDVLPLFFAAYFHDSIEDARQTYNDVMKTAKRLMYESQAEIATEIVYALTNEKGRTREERAGDRYYRGIRLTPYAPFLKLCDRFANYTYSCQGADGFNSHMAQVYRKEMPHFLQEIKTQSSDPRFQIPSEMTRLLTENEGSLDSEKASSMSIPQPTLLQLLGETPSDTVRAKSSLFGGQGKQFVRKYAMAISIVSLALLAAIAWGVYTYLGNHGRFMVSKTLDDGSRYHGYWQNGQPDGEGRLLAANGRTYSGTWHEGQLKEGHLEARKFQYDGEFQQLMMCGYGVCRYSDGSVYRGMWDVRQNPATGRKEEVKQGLGHFYSASGQHTFAFFENGVAKRHEGQQFTTGQQVYGIDISRRQGTIDWRNLALWASSEGEVSGRQGRGYDYVQPVSFTIMKSTEGATYCDKLFADNFAKAKQYGMVRGAYHYYKSLSSAEDQLKNFIDHTPLEKGDLPPVLDLEEDSHNDMSRLKDSILKAALVWLQGVEKHYGVTPIVYTNLHFYERYLRDHLAFRKYTFWLAAINVPQDKIRETPGWRFWQVSHSGRVRSISHDCDINLFNGNEDDLLSYIEANPIK